MQPGLHFISGFATRSHRPFQSLNCWSSVSFSDHCLRNHSCADVYCRFSPRPPGRYSRYLSPLLCSRFFTGQQTWCTGCRLQRRESLMAGCARFRARRRHRLSCMQRTIWCFFFSLRHKYQAVSHASACASPISRQFNGVSEQHISNVRPCSSIKSGCTICQPFTHVLAKHTKS